LILKYIFLFKSVNYRF